MTLIRTFMLRFLPVSSRIFRVLVVITTIALCAPRHARAHEGPPYPVIVDREVGSMLVSVWADPDIGTGRFFIVVEPAGEDDLPDDIRIEIGVRPRSGRLDEAMYVAAPQDVRYGERFVTEVEFDRGEWWNVRVIIESSAGSGTISADVEATPDGSLGPITLVLFLLPFLAVGFLWLKVALHKRRVRS